MTFTMNTTERIWELLYNDKRWFRFPKTLLQFMTPDEAVFFSYLNNLATLARAKRNDGWFYCTIRQVERDLKFDARKQVRLLKIFIDWKLMIRSRRGYKGRRWLKINKKLLLKKLLQHEEQIFLDLKNEMR